jgi:hypothetical protein
LTQVGLFSSNTDKSASIFSTNLVLSKETLPTGTCIFHVLSNLYSIFHFLNSSTDLAKSFVTVPAFGLGISHFGPNCFATGAKSLILSAVVIKTSKSNFQDLISFIISEDPKTSAPDFLASSNLSSDTKTATLFVFQVP